MGTRAALGYDKVSVQCGFIPQSVWRRAAFTPKIAPRTSFTFDFPQASTVLPPLTPSIIASSSAPFLPNRANTELMKQIVGTIYSLETIKRIQCNPPQTRRQQRGVSRGRKSNQQPPKPIKTHSTHRVSPRRENSRLDSRNFPSGGIAGNTWTIIRPISTWLKASALPSAWGLHLASGGGRRFPKRQADTRQPGCIPPQ